MFKVEFISPISGNTFKKGSYANKKAIRRANERFDMEFGGYLTAKITDASGKEFSIWTLPN